MSLINKMLQDLDARGGAGKRAGAGAGGDIGAGASGVRPVAAERTSRTAIAIGAGVGVLIVAIGGGTWYYLNRPVAPAVRPVTVAPAAAVVVPAVPAPVAAAAPPQAVVPEVAVAAPVEAAPVEAAPVEAAPVNTMSTEPVVPKPRPPRPAVAAPAAPAVSPPVRAAGAPAGPGATPRQQGENAYRRALAGLQEGRVTEAVAALEAAVQADPRHEAARQTLVGLLLENGRADEAMRHADLGLAQDPNQPQLAMVLARLQVERGGAAEETLLRTLPHAAGNADYIAFLAGVLQKQGRHRQAAEQYEAALRLQPANGVWWMGLGMSLQAENLRTKARDAYHKALAAGLAPELQSFVERRLAQLR